MSVKPIPAPGVSLCLRFQGAGRTFCDKRRHQLMKIAFFISDHGFGHIMRNVAVISAVQKMGHEVLLVTGTR